MKCKCKDRRGEGGSTGFWRSGLTIESNVHFNPHSEFRIGSISQFSASQHHLSPVMGLIGSIPPLGIAHESGFFAGGNFREGGRVLFTRKSRFGLPEESGGEDKAENTNEGETEEPLSLNHVSALKRCRVLILRTD